MNNYKVNNKIFATLEEASAYASDYLRATRVVLCIEVTRRKITHRYKLSWPTKRSPYTELGVLGIYNAPRVPDCNKCQCKECRGYKPLINAEPPCMLYDSYTDYLHAHKQEVTQQHG